MDTEVYKIRIDQWRKLIYEANTCGMKKPVRYLEGWLKEPSFFASKGTLKLIEQKIGYISFKVPLGR